MMTAGMVARIGRIRPGLSLLLTAALAGALVACGEPAGAGCVADDTCGPGQLCVDARCVPAPLDAAPDADAEPPATADMSAANDGDVSDAASGPDARVELDAAVASDAMAEPDAGAEPDIGTEPDAGTEPDIGTEPDAVVEPDVAIAPSLDAMPDAASAADAEVEPLEPEPDAEPDVDAAIEPPPEPEPQPEPEPEPDAAVEPPEPEPDADAAVDPPEPEPDLDAAIEPPPARDAEPEVDAFEPDVNADAPDAEAEVDAEAPDAGAEGDVEAPDAEAPDAGVPDAGVEVDAEAPDGAEPEPPVAPDPCDLPGADCTLCDGELGGPPCNGCPAGVRVPAGWVCIPPGEFMAGEADSLTACALPNGCRLDSSSVALEHPHPVWISRPYLMLATEFSWADWPPEWPLEGVGARPDDARLPIGRLSWYTAAEMLNRLSIRDGLTPCYTEVQPGAPAVEADGEGGARPQMFPVIRFEGVACTGYRLPTNPEWEHAARAGRSEPTPIGPLRWRQANRDEPLVPDFDAIMWHAGNTDRPQPVGQRPVEPHPWGLYDMLGNLIEWTEGEALTNDGGFSPDRVVVDPHGGPHLVWDHLPLVLKGGGLHVSPFFSRFASRLGRPPSWLYSYSGFRPVRTVPGFVVEPPPERLEPPIEDIGRMCPLPDDEQPAIVCQGQAAWPCNGCPAGVEVPHGWVCVAPGLHHLGRLSETECSHDECCYDYINDRPPHEVKLSRAYLIRATEITQGELFATLGINPSSHSTCGADCPATAVTIPEMMLALNRMSEAEGLQRCYDIEPDDCSNIVRKSIYTRSGHHERVPWRPGRQMAMTCERATRAARFAHYADCDGYRLPTEVEWEVAARGVGPHRSAATYGGDLVFEPDGLSVPALETIAWYSGNAALDYPLGFVPQPRDGGTCRAAVGQLVGLQPVGLLQPNGLGLCDTIGNAIEVTWDHKVDLDSLPWVDPVGEVPELAEHWQAPMTWRGGSALEGTYLHRAASRIGSPTGTGRLSSQGFRPVRTVWGDPPEPEPEPEPGVEPEPGPDPVEEAAVQMLPEDPCNEVGARCTRCAGDEVGPPCNGCPAGVDVPEGWVCIPPGGSIIGEPSALDACERPGGCLIDYATAEVEHAHPVWLTRPILMQVTEMSWRDWPDGIPAANPFRPAADLDMPVGAVTWYDAAEAMNALSRRDGLPECYIFEESHRQDRPLVRFEGADCPGYRLPTNAEWEYAARAGEARSTPIGPLRWRQGDRTGPFIEAFDDVMWSVDNANGLMPVGLRPIDPHRWGLSDMLGNAIEWTQGESLMNDGGFALDRVRVDPHGGPQDVWAYANIVLKGGGYGFDRYLHRFASRFSRPPGYRNSSTGLRAVRTVPGYRFEPPPDRLIAPPDEVERQCALPDLDAPPTVCDGGPAYPCNGCPAGIEVPVGWACIPPEHYRIGEAPIEEREDPPCAPAECCPGNGTVSREVELTRAYLVKTTEMTQGELFDLTGLNPSPYSTCGDDCPVTAITFPEAMLVLNRMSEADGLEPCYILEGCENVARRARVDADGDPVRDEAGNPLYEELGRMPWRPGRQMGVECAVATHVARDHYANCTGYRLPTEAEWEIAARGRGPDRDAATYNGDLTIEPGSARIPELDEIAWYPGNAALDYPLGWRKLLSLGGCDDDTPTVTGMQPVGLLRPNDFGVCDMIGNAAELVWDHRNYRDEASVDPVGLNPNAQRQHWDDFLTLSGGTAMSRSSYLRTSFHREARTGRNDGFGFRPVRTVWAEPPPQREPLDPCDQPGAECTLCEGPDDDMPPCNGCPEGVRVPAGWVCAPPGEFIMGQNAPDEECLDPDGRSLDCCRFRDFGEPPHPVRLSRPFLINTVETTRARWAFDEGNDDVELQRPQTSVSAHQMVRYLNTRSLLEGLEPCYEIGPSDSAADPDPKVRFLGADCTGYRLPTEAEWEYAARAGETAATPTGSLVMTPTPEGGASDTCRDWRVEGLESHVWWFGHPEWDGRGVMHVGLLEPNAWGLHDTIGNAAELTNDPYTNKYGGFPGYAATDPPISGGTVVDPFSGAFDWSATDAEDRYQCNVDRYGRGWRVRKGAHFASNSHGWLRFAHRFHSCSDYRSSAYGLREVRTVPGNWPTPEPEPLVVERHTICPGPPVDAAEHTPPCNGCPEGTVLPPGYVCAPPGAFFVGRNDPDNECVPHVCCGNGRQPTPVELTYGLVVKETKVTQSEIYALTGNNGASFSGCGPDCPAREEMYWMMAYLNALSESEGLPPCYLLCPNATNERGEPLNRPQDRRFICEYAGVHPDYADDYMACPGYRLPTDIEWEYVARAGETGAVFGGPLIFEAPADADTIEACHDVPVPALEPIAWSLLNSRIDNPHLARLYPKTTRYHPEHLMQPVAQLAPNGWGLYDVLGNMAERVWDHWHYRPGDGALLVDPQPHVTGEPIHWESPLTIRGSSFGEHAYYHRLAGRRRSDGTTSFRPVRTLPPRAR